MRMFIGSIAILLALGAGNEAFAQKTWTLDQCIDHALNNHLNIRQAELSQDQNKLNLSQSKGNVLPSLNANGSHNYNFGRTIDPFTNQFVNQSIQSNGFQLNSGMNLFSGLQNYHGIKQAQNNILAGLAEIEAAKNNVSLGVATLFLQAVMNKKQAEIALLQQKITEAQIDRTQTLVDAGSINALTLYSLEAQLANDELNAVNLNNAFTQSLVALQTALMLNPAESFDIAIPDITAPEIQEFPPLQALVQEALVRMPEVEAAKLRLVSADLGEKMARGAMSPRLTVFANINTVYSESRREITDTRLDGFREIGFVQGNGTPVLIPNYEFSYGVTPFGDQIKDNFGQALGFGMSIPILNGLQTHTAIARSKIQKEQQSLQVQQAENQIYTDVAAAWANVMASEKRYLASLKNEEAQERNYRFSEKRFDAGMLNGAELIQAKNAWSNSQLGRIQSAYEYVFRKNVIYFYQGIPMKLN